MTAIHGRFGPLACFCTLLLLLIAGACSDPLSPELVETEVTASIWLDKGRPYFDHNALQSYTHVSIRNVSSTDLHAPLKLVIDSVTPAGVSVANPDGLTAEAKPYLDLSDALGGDAVLSPGETSAPRELRFDNPDTLRFDFSVSVWASEEPAPVNRPPEIVSSPPASATVGGLYSYPVIATDPDQDPLHCSLTQGPAGMVIDAVSGLLEWTPAAAGVYAVTVEVSDPAGASDSQSFDIDVAPITPPNEPPIADAGPDAAHTLAVGETEIDVVLDGSASSDSDGSVESYLWSGSPDPADVTQPSVRLAAGVHTFSLVVIDDDGAASDPDSVTIEIEEPHPPQVLVSPLDYSVAEGGTLSVTVSCSDPDGGILVLAATPSLANSSFSTAPGTSPTGSFDFSPDYEQAGLHAVTFSATDPTGLIGSQTVQITVIDVNRPPTADPQTLHVAQNTPESITLSGADPDGDSLTYAVVSGPTHGDLSGTPPDLVYTPDPDHLGDDSFDFKVDDGNGGTDVATIAITVATNQPPRITSMPLTVAGVDYEYVYPVVATDPEGDPLSYALAVAPDGMGIDPAGVIRWTPLPDQISGFPGITPPVGVSVQVADSSGGSDTQTYSIRVSGENSEAGNHPPIAHAGDDYTVEEGAPGILDGSHSFDADGDHLRFFWVQTEGPAVELDNPHASQPAFTAPLVNGTATISFDLTVNDGTLDGEPDEVHVMVLDMDMTPEGVVTNSNLDGPGSLRAAVEHANANPGTHITFSIPDTDPSYDPISGVWSLVPPRIHGTWYIWIRGNGTFIDGMSQTLNHGDRNPHGPEIEISGGYNTIGIWADDVVIRGLVLNNPGNPAASIGINGGRNIVITGSYIGTDPTGTQIRSPGNCGGNPYFGSHGIVLYVNPIFGGAIDNVRIGGSAPGEGNIISGLGLYGIWLQGKVGFTWREGDPEIGAVTIQGNIIGPDRTGTVSLVDCGGYSVATGIYSEFNRADLLVGGVTPGSRNVISGWSRNVGLATIAGRSRIQGNYIGTDLTGTLAVPPTRSGAWGIGVSVYDGIEDYPADQVLIGGSVPGAGNLISGNPTTGITLEDDYKYIGHVDVQGNLIGTDPTGTVALPNGTQGIYLRFGVSAWIGGTGPGEGNVIAGNGQWGIWQYDDWRAPYGHIKGNKIGLAADGVTPLGNGAGGIYVGMDSGAVIGGNEIAAGNVIAHNGGPGIHFPGWWNNNYTAYRRGRPLILGNSIHSNASLGISRAGTVQGNDPGDADLVVYHLQNFPIITEVTVANGMTHVSGALDTYKPENCQIELFSNSSLDPSGHGEGGRWLVSLHPDSDGSFEVTLPEELSGAHLTATATRTTADAGDPAPRSSEFSEAVLVGASVSTNLPPDITSSPPSSVVAEDAYEYQVIAHDPEGQALTYSLALAPAGMSISAGGLIAWTPTTDQEGRNVATVVVRDELGLLDSQNFSVEVLPLVDLDPPVISVSIPLGLTIEAPYELIGTVRDAYLISYAIEMAPAGTNDWTLMDEGGVNVVNDLVGVIDPTRLANGLYDLRISAIDAGGRETVFYSSVEIAGQLKIGQFSLAFEDIAIPVSGLPISVVRSYDSFDKEKGDFGVGWDMALASGVKLQVTRTLGESWHAEEDYFFDPGGTGQGAWVYKLETPNVPKVLITYADGRQDRFEFRPDFVTQPAFDPRFVRPYFIALEGTTSTLEAIADNDLILHPWPAYPAGDQLLDSNLDVYDPDLYRLTTAEGMQLLISLAAGLQSITDRNGNTLTFGPNGIAHSSGLSIDIQRDAEGRITQVIDPDGGNVAYSYDGEGDLVGFTDQDGNLTQYAYDGRHNLVSIIDPSGTEILQVQYDAQGRMIGTVDGLGNPMAIVHDIGNAREHVTDRNGHTTIYEYDGDGNVISQTDPNGHATVYAYDAHGNRLSETDPLGNTTTWTYDAQDNRLSETDPLGNTRTWTYNIRNQVTSITDPLGNVTTFAYDANGNLISTINPLGETIGYTYDGAGLRTSKTDCAGNVTTYQYEAYGRMTAVVDPLGNTTSYTYDGNGNRLSETDALGNTTTFAYSATGRLVSTTDPLGNVATTEFDASGQRSAQTDKNGHRTAYAYDAAGRLVTTTYPDGNTEHVAYDAMGNVAGTTDRAGGVSVHEYAPTAPNSPARLLRLTYPDGSSTSTEYDAAGRVSARIDENGNRTSRGHDAAGRVISVTDALGNVSAFTYDAARRQISAVDANGHVTAHEYDALGRIVRTIFPDGTSTQTAYASAACGEDRRLSETDQNGNTTLFEYDALGRLVRVTDALGGTTAQAYDAVGNRISRTDANGSSTRWEYDALGRVTRHILPLGMSETFSYDAEANRVGTTDFNGNTVSHAYDALNRRVNTSYPDGSAVGYTYTANGRYATITDARGVTAYSYDSRGRLTQVSNPGGAVVGYGFDAAGNRITLVTPSGTTSYAYDALDRLVSVGDAVGSFITYGYDATGNRTDVARANGMATEYSYDSLSRMTSVVNRDSGGGIASSHAYTLDAAGNRIRVVEDGGRSVDYVHDALHRLTREEIVDPLLGNESISYTYDGVGNRLTKTDSGAVTSYVYDSNDRLVSETTPIGTIAYLYDENGNTLSRTAGGATVSYGYDYENRLVSAQDGASLAEYAYDSDGVRVRSTVDGVRTDFLVDKNRTLAQVVEERDGSGALLAGYVHGGDLVSMNRSGSTSYYLYDAQLSTRALADATGAITDRYVYDAFGELIDQSGATENPHRYSGERYDAETGFYYLRARYYDPAIGRFTSRDLHPGDASQPFSLHRYLYAGANPVLFVDPTGRFTLNTLMVTMGAQNALRSMAWSLGVEMVMGSATLKVTKKLAEHVWVPAQQLYNETLFANLEYDLPEKLVWRSLKWARQGIAVGMGSLGFNIGIPDLGLIGQSVTDIPLRRLATRVSEEIVELASLSLSPPAADLREAMITSMNEWTFFCSSFGASHGGWMCTP